METKKGKTVFIEYSSSAKGQHFITVVQNVDHNRIIIGRIYREYDKETNKYNFRATDFEGGQIFVDIKDLYALKRNYIEHGPNLAMSIPKNPNRVRPEKPIYINKGERNTELKNIREKKTSKEKTNEVSKTNPDQKEKEQDSGNTVKYKDNERDKDEGNSKENIPQQEVAESNSVNPFQEYPIEPEKSERDIELENIREDNEDREQDMEIDR
ncbi:MAG: hypothetical protein V1904_10565 [Bacteroidota bacterium]